MIVALVVLPQQIRAVIVPIGRAHQCMDVVARPCRGFERDRRLMIELDQNDRAVDPVVACPDRVKGGGATMSAAWPLFIPLRKRPRGRATRLCGITRRRLRIWTSEELQPANTINPVRDRSPRS